MNDIKLTIDLSEQALLDLLDCLEVGIQNLNQEYRRYSDIVRLYDRILDADRWDKKKISFRYNRKVIDD
ncbi:hypothetical protein [uncultured Anaerococcus sp.]|uniref:hypothetical protein n=1 Tax=uncultured Anaerococcus sp. TaxID=293428 RepID=UPI00288C599C|nr:hypothetical protein [uncultured Anaerococcus sp.]